MRILISTFSRAMVGGVETYLRTIVPALIARRHEVVLLHELSATEGEDTIDGGLEHLRTIPVAALGRDRALDAARDLAPDVVYQHGVMDPNLERRLLDVAPAVLFAHGHNGMCISGTRRFKRPTPQPCMRQFGPMCLLLYEFRGCGGRSPIRMLKEYSKQMSRHGMLAGYAAIAVASRHMADELARHDVQARVLHLPLTWPVEASPPLARAGPPARILFAGRLTQDKGVRLLAPAAELAGARLGRRLEVRFAGSGPEERWVRALRPTSHASIQALGWLGRDALREEMREADLLVMPSVWAEPFGLSGVEAAAVGLPAVAYDVGGIREWLHGGVNGELAELRSDRVVSLADAIVRALERHEHWNALRMGAWTSAREFTADAHMTSLEALLGHARTSRPHASQVS